MKSTATKLRNQRNPNENPPSCTSFVIMQQLEITTALTTDHHFEQAGFLLK
jgi:hypothetical protein